MSYSEYRAACFAHTKQQLQQALTADQLLIQAYEMYNDLQKVTNNLAKRLREWTGGWIPELDSVKDHEYYTHLLATKSHAKILKELDRKESIGTDIPETDKAAIRSAANRLLGLYDERQQILTYLDTTMKKIMPNTQVLCGTTIAAELLSHAGSLQRFARLPSGTIQLLGAETALFRHLKNRKNRPPKHGLIFNHQFIQQAPRNDRGKIARALADKIALCARVDYFKGEPCGEAFKKSLEKRFS